MSEALGQQETWYQLGEFVHMEEAGSRGLQASKGALEEGLRGQRGLQWVEEVRLG